MIFISVDPCARHNECSSCLSGSGCGWCPVTSQCHSMSGITVSACGGCPGGLLQTCDPETIANQKEGFLPSLLQLKKLDIDGDLLISLDEYILGIGEWLPSAGDTEDSFHDMD